MLEWAERFFAEIKITDVLLVIFTGLLWWSTHKLWIPNNNVSNAALEQDKDMKASIAKSTRAANAMEKVAESIAISAAAATKSVATTTEILMQQKNFAQLQLRAYLSVAIHNAVYQNSRGLFFEGQPIHLNNGNTPAHKISYWARADILAWPLPPEFSFPPSAQTAPYAAVLAARQTFILNAKVSEYVKPEDVENVKRGVGIPPKRLCIWVKLRMRISSGNDTLRTFVRELFG